MKLVSRVLPLSDFSLNGGVLPNSVNIPVQPGGVEAECRDSIESEGVGAESGCLHPIEFLHPHEVEPLESIEPAVLHELEN